MKKSLLVFFMTLPLVLFAEGNPEAGKRKSQACIACHGEKGQSFNKSWPNLAGQHAEYLLKQLNDFKSKNRDNPMMWPFVQNLSAQDIEDLAAYYASLPLENKKSDKEGEGAILYKAGNRKKQITACIACHGPKALGNGAAMFPRLAGQNAEYTISQMQAFKTKTRINDLQSIMHDISVRMSQDEIELIAHYLEGL